MGDALRPRDGAFPTSGYIMYMARQKAEDPRFDYLC